MRIILFILALLAFFFGAAILLAAKSAIHEIEAFILFVIGAIFLSSEAIIYSINLKNQKDKERRLQKCKLGLLL